MAIETGLGMLIAPLFTAGAVLGMLTFDEEDRHHIGAVSVSQSMAYRGFTGEVATHALHAHLKDHYYRIDSHAPSPLLPLLEEQTSEVLAEVLHVDRIVLAARRLRGLVASEYNFAFIQERDGRHVLHVTEVEGDDKRLTRWRFAVEDDDYEAAIAAAARQVVFEIDPTLIALDHLLKEELDLAEGALEHCRQRCAYSNMASNDLLRGVLALKRDDLDGAQTAFRAAQLRHPELETAAIGLAVVDARRNDFAAARARLAYTAHRPLRFSAEERHRVAALRTAEGRLLAREGRPREAAKVLETATALGTANYRLHVELSKLYQELKFDGAAAYHGRRAEQLRSGVYGSIDVVQAMLLDMMR